MQRTTYAHPPKRSDLNFLLRSSDPRALFSPVFTKPILHFCGTGEDEYRQKTSRSHARKCCCRYPGGFQRRAGMACLWHTILRARSGVLYLLLRPNKAIRSCGRACAVTLTDDLVPPFPNETRFAGLSFWEGVGSEGEMKCSPHFQRNKRYIIRFTDIRFLFFPFDFNISLTSACYTSA